MVLKISNDNMSFDLQFEGKYTLVIGDSATGKTTLCNMLADYFISPNLFSFRCDHEPVLWERQWGVGQLAENKGKLIIIDEFAKILKSSDVSKVLLNAENYFLIFNRKILKFLPIGVDNVFTLEIDKNNVHSLKPVFRRFNEDKRYHLSNNTEVIITEDAMKVF